MSGVTNTTIILRAVAVLLLTAAWAIPVAADFEGGEDLLSFSFGYAGAELQESGQWLSGTMFTINLDHFLAEGQWSLTVNASFTTMDPEVQPSDTMKQEVTTWPVYLGGKYWFGPGPLKLYVGGALGVYLSTLKTTPASTGVARTDVSNTGMGLAVPAGVTLRLGKYAALYVNYTLHWLWSSDAVKNNVLHTVGAGVGFRISGP